MINSTDLRVAELGDSPGTAWCGKLLGAVGAHVVKIMLTSGREPAAWPRGSPGSLGTATSVYLDSDKRMAAVDWHSADGAASARSLLVDQDVIVTPLSAAELDERGLDHRTLSRDRPGLVIAHGTMFGEGGRYQTLAGSGLQALALSGLLSMVGEPDRPPLRLAGLQPEYTLGLSLFTGIMLALYGRAHGPGGATVVTTSAVRSLAYLDFKSLAYLESEARVLGRGSDRGPLVLRCADGHVGFYYRPEEWQAVTRTLGTPALDDPRFATQAGRDRNRAALRDAMEQGTRSVRKVDLYHRAQAAGLPVGAVLTVPELLDDPQYRAREFLQRRTVPGIGAVTMPSAPWLVDGERPCPRVAVRAPEQTPAGTSTAEPFGPARSGGVLAGLKVLDLSSITAGGRSTQLLADFGAEVVKLEAAVRPDPFRHWSVVTGAAELGDLASPPFRVVGRNKRGVAVDLKDPRGREICRRLVAWADLVVENFRRGVLDRLGLDFETLRGWNERIVLLSMSSQGSTGPDAGYISFGVTLEALGGLMALTGYDPDTPVWSTPKVNYPDQVVSLLAPGLGVWGVTRSRRTGRGTWIDLSQRETVTALLGEYLVHVSATGQPPLPEGNRGRDGLELLCRCAGEDEWLALSITTDRQWAALCDLIARPELRTDRNLATASARAGREPEVTDLVQQWTLRHDKRAAMWQLQQQRIPAAAVLRASELAAEDADRGESFHVRAPRPDHTGDEAQVGWPFQLTPGGRPSVRLPPPHLGEHTREVLAELGYPPGEIDGLLAANVVAVATTVPANENG